MSSILKCLIKIKDNWYLTINQVRITALTKFNHRLAYGTYRLLQDRKHKRLKGVNK